MFIAASPGHRHTDRAHSDVKNCNLFLSDSYRLGTST